MGGDGQVSLGQTAVKHDAKKLRRLADGKVLAGFAGAAADAFALLDQFDGKLLAPGRSRAGHMRPRRRVSSTPISRPSSYARR